MSSADTAAARPAVIDLLRARERATLMRWLIAVVLVIAVGMLALLGGAEPIGIDTLQKVLTGEDARPDGYILTTVRAPRVLLGITLGWALGLGGSVVQQLLRNPLASPDIVGINQGATLAVVATLVVLNDRTLSVPFIAMAGALVVAAVIAVLADDRQVRGQRLILMGIGMGALCNAGVAFLLSQTDVYRAAEAIRWISGSLSGSTWAEVSATVPLVAVLSVIALGLARYLQVLLIGDEGSAALGVSPARTRVVLLLVAIGLSALSVSAAGPITFVAFAAGPIAALLNRGRYSMPLAGLVGAVVLVLADFIGEHAFAPYSLPAGMVTGALGAPFMVAVLIHLNRKAS